MNTSNILIYVPSGSDHMGIAQGSGIVGVPSAEGNVTIYYEGNLNGCMNLGLYEERLQCALGRLVMKYPTVARSCVPASALTVVGHAIRVSSEKHIYDLDIGSPQQVQAWLGDREKLTDNRWLMHADKDGARRRVEAMMRSAGMRPKGLMDIHRMARDQVMATTA